MKHINTLMKEKKDKLISSFYLKYLMAQAGNDSVKLQDEINDVLKKLEQLLIFDH